MARGGERPLIPAVSLPPLPDRALLADLCRETAAQERLQPQVIEKDFYLTRLLWALGKVLGERALLKGGTLLSKVDLGFKRMSEDADLVVPGPPSREKRANVHALNRIRDALKSTAEVVGLHLPFPDGQHFERGSHRQWELVYESNLGLPSINRPARARRSRSELPSLHPPCRRQARRARRATIAQAARVVRRPRGTSTTGTGGSHLPRAAGGTPHRRATSGPRSDVRAVRPALGARRNPLSTPARRERRDEPEEYPSRACPTWIQHETRPRRSSSLQGPRVDRRRGAVSTGAPPRRG